MKQWYALYVSLFFDHVVLKFDKHLGTAATDVRVKFQSLWKS